LSHVVSIRTQVKDAAAVQAACSRLGLAPAEAGSFTLFSGTETGLGVQLSGWTYPVVCQLETGELRYDNFGGSWGEQAQLDRFLQAYAVEKAKLEARKQGYSVSEQQLSGGSIGLTLQVSGGAA
jgi:hypothetical protein